MLHVVGILCTLYIDPWCEFDAISEASFGSCQILIQKRCRIVNFLYASWEGYSKSARNKKVDGTVPSYEDPGLAAKCWQICPSRVPRRFFLGTRDP